MANFKKSIDSAVSKFSKGSSDLVRLYEKCILSYWNTEKGGDARGCDNVQYFANALRFHPFIQGAMVAILRKHGSFNIESIEKLEDGKKVKEYAITNSKKKLTATEITGYISIVTKFVEAQYQSFLHDPDNAKKNPFDLTKKINSFGGTVAQILAGKLAQDGDENASVDDVVAALKAKIDEMVNAENLKKIRDKAKEEIAVKEAAQAVTELAANSEEPEQAAVNE